MDRGVEGSFGLPFEPQSVTSHTRVLVVVVPQRQHTLWADFICRRPQAVRKRNKTLSLSHTTRSSPTIVLLVVVERERGRPLRHDVGFSSIVLHTVPLEFAVAWLLDYLYSLCHHLHPQEPPLCLYLSLLSRRLITRHEPGAGGKTEDKSKKKVQFFIRRRRLVGDESAGRKRKKRGIHAPVTNATRRERNKERKSAQNGALESRSNVLKFI